MGMAVSLLKQTILCSRKQFDRIRQMSGHYPISFAQFDNRLAFSRYTESLNIFWHTICLSFSFCHTLFYWYWIDIQYFAANIITVSTLELHANERPPPPGSWWWWPTRLGSLRASCSSKSVLGAYVAFIFKVFLPRLQRFQDAVKLSWGQRRVGNQHQNSVYHGLGDPSSHWDS